MLLPPALGMVVVEEVEVVGRAVGQCSGDPRCLVNRAPDASAARADTIESAVGHRPPQ